VLMPSKAGSPCKEKNAAPRYVTGIHTAHAFPWEHVQDFRGKKQGGAILSHKVNNRDTAPVVRRDKQQQS